MDEMKKNTADLGSCGWNVFEFRLEISRSNPRDVGDPIDKIIFSGNEFPILIKY